MNTTKLHLPYSHQHDANSKEYAPAKQITSPTQPYYNEEDRDRLMAKFIFYTIIGLFVLAAGIISLIIVL